MSEANASEWEKEKNSLFDKISNNIMIDIVTVNYPLDGDRVVNTEVTGDITLLDADVVICDPSRIMSLWAQVERSKDNIRYLYSPYSDRIRDIINSRRVEIESLLENGKVIISFMTPPLSVAKSTFSGADAW